jgi:AAA15 family ATPase/GTPase
MKIIEKIEIKHFRSFDGGAEEPKVEVLDLKDINIFSGTNDSGKSNILRALNLFFNNEISPGVSFDLERDLSKIQRKRSEEKAKGKRESVLPEEFFVE